MNVTRPKKSLGQHFLVDENILGVIGRLAELAPEDVVLEIGPGVGMLTDFLAKRVSRVVAVELDTSLDPVLGRVKADPGILCANLPYNIATPLLVESLDGLPHIERWCVMVQREVADRLFATPSTKAYGAVSVLVQLVCERTGFHPVSRTVFRPPPNVDSALVAFRRVALPDQYSRIKQVVGAAFAHRRKTLPNSLELAGLASRADAAQALDAIGRDSRARAEALEPQEFVALTQALP